MIDVGLAAVANQTLSVQIDERQYVLDIHEANGVMCVSISRDGVPLVSGSRVTAGTALMPYKYLESDAGNFIVTVDGEAVPYWDQFGITQFLVYVSAEELAAYRA